VNDSDSPYDDGEINDDRDSDYRDPSDKHNDRENVKPGPASRKAFGTPGSAKRGRGRPSKQRVVVVTGKDLALSKRSSLIPIVSIV